MGDVKKLMAERMEARRRRIEGGVVTTLDYRISASVVAQKQVPSTQAFSLGASMVGIERVTQSDAAAICSHIEDDMAYEALRVMENHDNKHRRRVELWLVAKASDWASEEKWKIDAGDLDTLAQLAVDEMRNGDFTRSTGLSDSAGPRGAGAAPGKTGMRGCTTIWEIWSARRRWTW